MEKRPEYDFSVIGKNLRMLRLANQFTVEEVRDYLQLGSVQAIYKWERGQGLPQADTLIALLQLYGENRIDRLVEESLALSFGFLAKNPLNFRFNDIAIFLH